MKVFKKLIISGDTESLNEVIAYLQSLSGDWSYDEQKSLAYANGIGEKAQNAITLGTTTKDGRNVFVWMVRRYNNIKLTNITSGQSRNLNIDEYNEIVDSLIDKIKNNCKTVFSFEASNSDVTFDEIAGSEVATVFYDWVATCNPTTGNTHPNDAERWDDFVILCHKNKNKSKLDGYYLEKFLKEEKKFYDDSLISSLVHDFEYGLNLLSRNDRF